MPETADDDLLAQAVGWVVIRAGRAEGTAGELVMLHREPHVSVKRSGWHESGEPLVQALTDLADRLSSDELRTLAHRLRKAAEWRHDVVHGEWVPAPGVGVVTFRRQRPKVAPDGGYAGRQWTIERLQHLGDEYRTIESGLANLVSDFTQLPRSTS